MDAMLRPETEPKREPIAPDPFVQHRGSRLDRSGREA